MPLIWALVILVAHSVPGEDLVYHEPWQLFRLDKAAHMVMSAILLMALMVAFRKQDTYRTLKFHARKWSTIITLAYGALLETYQGFFFERRSMEMLDFAADGIGCAAGLVLFRVIYGRALSHA